MSFMSIKVWVGRYESDVLTYNQNPFDYSITYYGSNKKNNFAYSTKMRWIAKYDNDFADFMNSALTNICQKDDIEIFFYSNDPKNVLLSKYPNYTKYCRNCNDNKLIDWLNNKTYTRLWLDNIVEVPKYTLLSKYECTYNHLHAIFPDFDEFIIQKNYSSGGEGTYRLTQQNESSIIEKLSLTEPYLVSAYYKNTFSLCCHVIIAKDNNIIFPLGQQLLSPANHRISYEGTDYSFFKNLNKVSTNNCMEFIEKISNLLSQNGYRGICGYDFLLINNKPILIEINPRFMGSSYLINHVLAENEIPSLFTLNTMAFQNNPSIQKYKRIIMNMDINYYTKTIRNFEGKDNIKPPKRKWLFTDGLTENMQLDSDVYLYRFFDRT